MRSRTSAISGHWCALLESRQSLLATTMRLPKTVQREKDVTAKEIIYGYTIPRWTSGR